jgi:hypothetical protein
MGNPPALASGSRDLKQPRPLPRRIRDVIELMVRGDDEDRPVDFVGAARIAGMRPADLRKWFDRPAFLQALRAERKAWRNAVCAGNESALKRVRDKSENGMAVIHAVRGLEDLSEREVVSSRNQGQTPGITIVITQPERQPEPRTIEHAEPLEPELDP